MFLNIGFFIKHFLLVSVNKPRNDFKFVQHIIELFALSGAFPAPVILEKGALLVSMTTVKQALQVSMTMVRSCLTRCGCGH
jgi:hypothetical protein